VPGVARHRSSLFPILVLTVAVVAAGPAPAETVTLAPERDNTLYRDPVGSLSNGAGEHLFAGGTARGGVRRGLLAFDVAAGVPAGATITGADLTLHMSRSITGARDVSLHRVLADWGEGASDAFGEEGIGAESTPGDATWIHTFFNTGFWTIEGGDRVAAPSAARSVEGPGRYTWSSTPELVADVQAWLDDPTTNHGWMVVGDEQPGGAKRFDSREHRDETVRPVLTIEFTMGAPEGCDPDPKPRGYWHRQCIAVSPAEGGLRPGNRGRGPNRLLEPDFTDEVMPCVDRRLAELGFAETACRAIVPTSAPCQRALSRLVSLLANVCSDRLQPGCGLESDADACGRRLHPRGPTEPRTHPARLDSVPSRLPARDTAPPG
jgi:hypothetical protein